MSEGKRSRLSLTQRTEIWSRWKSGQSLHEIGRTFGKPHSCIRSLLLPRGGIPPAARRRSHLALTLAEREDLSRGIASGSSIREQSSCCEPQVAGYRCEEIGVGPVAISLLAQQDRWIYRERTLRRNPGRYQPEQAHS